MKDEILTPQSQGQKKPDIPIYGEMNDEQRSIQDKFESFKTGFWLFIIATIAGRGLIYASEDANTVLIGLAIQILSIIGLCITLGKASVAVSGEKKNWVKGFWGIVWLFYIGPIIGYFEVKRLTKDAIKKAG